MGRVKMSGEEEDDDEPSPPPPPSSPQKLYSEPAEPLQNHNHSKTTKSNQIQQPTQPSKNHHSQQQQESKQIEGPQQFKTESDEEFKQIELSKHEDHHSEDEEEEEEEEEESKRIDDDDDDDGPPPGWRHSLDFPLSSTLPPTPPLPSPPPSSSPRDLDMEQQDSDEDDGPPPGWDNKYQLQEQQMEQVVTLAATAISSDIQTEDVRLDAHNEEGEARLQAHTCLPPEVAPPDFDMEQRDSDEDDGPPPGWDNRYQLKGQQAELLSLATTSTISSDIQTKDVEQDAHNEDEPRSQAHPCLPPEVTPSVEEQDSEDDGPPPGWDSKCKPEPKLQETPQADTKMEDVLQDAQNEGGQSQPTPEVPSDMIVDSEDSEDEGPPPGWDSKCQPEPKSQFFFQTDSSDIETNVQQHDAQIENGPQSQSQSRSSPAPDLVVPSDIKGEEQDSEDDGPPPGWNSKCQRQPVLQMACPTTPPSEIKIEEDKEHAQDTEGSPPGWRSTPQQQSHIHSSLPSPIVQSGPDHEPNNVKTIEERPQPPSGQQSIHPTKQQILVPKPPTKMNNPPEMGQMVCGSCRHLLSYPRGARYVECACCLEENFVLEEHEVGQVVCGNCNLLLMFPYGAPKVRCANCGAETEIGDQNRRPPLSEHKRRARQHLKRVQAG